MTVSESPNTESVKQNSLQAIVQTWKNQIICFPPQGTGYEAHFVDPRDGGMVNYIYASCDELRHLGTNYNSLLNKIKEQFYGYLKEAILNTVKYEATRRVVKKQHEWIQSSYRTLIEQKELSAEQQSSEIDSLKAVIDRQQQEIAGIKTQAENRQEEIEAEALLAEKEAEIAQKNREIELLNQQLQQCDREINGLKSELNKGLQELKHKYRGMIAQFVMNYSQKQQANGQNKSLQACKNIFVKAQNKINLLQCENKLLMQKNLELQGKTKVLRL